MILPEPAAPADFALLTGPEGEFCLAYELPRDFLSAPRQYAIVVGSLGAEGQLLHIYGQSQELPQDDGELTIEAEADEEFLREAEGYYCLRLANDQQLVQLSATHLVLNGTLFDSRGPQAAILASLGSPLTG